jgi:hypothetical protein
VQRDTVQPDHKVQLAQLVWQDLDQLVRKGLLDLQMDLLVQQGLAARLALQDRRVFKARKVYQAA